MNWRARNYRKFDVLKTIILALEAVFQDLQISAGQRTTSR